MRDRNELAKLAAMLGGLPVLACRPGSPADRAGVRYGDILISVNGVKTPDWATFIEARSKDSERLKLQLFRDGMDVSLDLELSSSATPLDPPALLAEILSERIVPLAKPDGEKN